MIGRHHDDEADRTHNIVEGAVFEPAADMAFAPRGLTLSYKHEAGMRGPKPGTASLSLVLPSPTGQAWAMSHGGLNPQPYWTDEERQKLEAVARACFDIRRPGESPLQGDSLRSWLEKCMNDIVRPFDARRSGNWIKTAHGASPWVWRRRTRSSGSWTSW